MLDYGPGCERKIKTGTRVVAQPMLRVGNEIHIARPVTHRDRRLRRAHAAAGIRAGPGTERPVADMAALTEPMAVALHAVRRSEIARKDVAIVIGCGPVGLAVICLLKSRGVETVMPAISRPGDARSRSVAAPMS